MKYTLTLIVAALILVACHKDKKTTLTPVHAFSDDATSIGLELEHRYTVVNEFNAVSIVIFHADGTITEGGEMGDSLTYHFSYNYRDNFSPQVLQGGKGMQIIIDSPYHNPGSMGMYGELWYVRSSGAPYDSLTFGTFISGPVVQNSSPTMGMTGYAGRKALYFIH